MSEFGFDTTGYVQESRNLPIGKYRARITGAEIKDSENIYNPKYVSVGFDILTGEHKGKIKQQLFNVWHEKPNVRGIARDSIDKMAKSTGKEIKFSGVDDVNQAFANRFVVLEVTAGKNDFVNVKYFNADEVVPEIENNEAPF